MGLRKCYGLVVDGIHHEIDESKPVERFAYFDFDEARYLVRYWSDREIGDEIEDAISSLTDDGALDKVHTTSDELVDYEKFIQSVMDSFNVEWEFVPIHRYWV